MVKNEKAQQTEKRIIEFDEYVNHLIEFDKPVTSVWENKESEASLPIDEKIVANSLEMASKGEPSFLDSLELEFTNNQVEEHFSKNEIAEDFLEKEATNNGVGVQEQQEESQHDSMMNASLLSEQITEFSEKVDVHFSSVETQIEKLKRDFETKLMIDTQKDQIIDNLHRELQVYKNNENQDRFLPLIRDLISLIDKLDKQCTVIEEKSINDPEKLLKIIKYTTQDVEDILYRQGVEPMPVQPSKFDSKRHKIVKTIKTNEQEKNRQIAAVYGKGYSWGERLIRPEQVAVYVYQPEAFEE